MTTHFHRPRAVAILIVFTLASAATAQDFHSRPYGYSLDVPDEWIEIPGDIIRESMAAMINQQSAVQIIYDSGFQLDAAETWFEYPYLLIQPSTYANMGIHRQLNEDEFPRLVQAITGLDLADTLDTNLSAEGRNLLGAFESNEPVLDAPNRRYLWTMDMDVQGVGTVRGLMVGYFGREAIIQLAFYARLSEWDQYATVRQTFIDSFRFDAAKAYSETEALAGPTPSSDPSRFLRKFIIYGVIVALIAIAAVIKGVAGKRKAAR